MHRVDNSTATKSGWTGTGNTSIESAVISSIADTTGIRIGNYVSVSSGFADIGRLRVIAKGASSITVDRNAIAAVTGATITALAGMYTDGVSGEEARTTLNSKHLNEIQEEIANVIESADIALAAGNTKQLSSAVVLTKKTSQTIDGSVDITGELILSGNTGKSKRISEGVFGGKFSYAGTVLSPVDYVSYLKFDSASFRSVSTNLEIPTDDYVQFKIKYQGKYLINFKVFVNTATASSSGFGIALRINGVVVNRSGWKTSSAVVGFSDSACIVLTDCLSLSTNDVLAISVEEKTSIANIYHPSFNLLMVGD